MLENVLRIHTKNMLIGLGITSVGLDAFGTLIRQCLEHSAVSWARETVEMVFHLVDMSSPWS